MSARYRRTRTVPTETSHRFGMSKTLRAYDTLTAISNRKQDLWEAYHEGRITSAELDRRKHALEIRRQRVVEITRAEEFRPGDEVVSKWGERRKITGSELPSWGGGRMYRTIDSRGVQDLWPGEVIQRRVR